MEDDREKVLASIRRGLRGIEQSNAQRDSRSPLKAPLSADFGARFEKFKSELLAVGGEAYVFNDQAEISDFLIKHSADGAAVFLYDELSRDYEASLSQLKGSGVVKLSSDFKSGYDKRDAAVFGSAILPCAACVAETGTVVLHNNMRLPAALATRLFVVTEPDRLIASFDELFTEKFRDSGGSNLFMITGPSKTADIEKELVTGVHGPKEVYVIFYQK